MNLLNQIHYILLEARCSFRLFSINTIASLTTIFLTSLFVCLMTFFFLSSSNLIQKSLQENQLRLFIAEESEDQKTLENLHQRLKILPYIDSILLVSKEDALNEYRLEFGKEMLDNTTYNPLPPSFILYLGKHYQKTEHSQKLHKQLKSWKEIETLSQASEYVQWIERWRWSILFSFGIISFLFGLFLILLISNTIKINLFSRKSIIKNMLYCGASYSQLFFPHLVEHLILCFIGGIFSASSIYLLHYFFNQFFTFLNPNTFYFIYVFFFILPFILVIPTCHYTIHRIIKKIK